MPATWTCDAPARGRAPPVAAVSGLLDVASAPLCAEKLLHAPAPGTVQAIHLHRDHRQGPCQTGNIECLRAIAPPQRQAQIAQTPRRPERWAPALWPQARALCARMACGLSADGVAFDLDVAPFTVLTLRKRACLKLTDAGLPANRLRLARLLT